MPQVAIEMMQSSLLDRAQIITLVRRALVQTLEVQEEDWRECRIYIINIEDNQCYSPDAQPNNICIKIMLFPGRSQEVKTKLFHSISSLLKAYDSTISILTILEEVPKENFGIDAISAKEIY